MNSLRLTLPAAAALLLAAAPAGAAGDPEKGALLFRACAMCHSLQPDRNMTGPSLAGVWGRKAASLKGFQRYSAALKAAGLAWDDTTLDAWITSPQAVAPHTTMTFPGVADAGQRADIIAFLKIAGSGAGAAAALSEKMRQAINAHSAGFEDLKKLGPEHQVQSIRYCHDAYQVITADGVMREFWEANLRFKTDSSDTGPLPGKPAILPAGMGEDRASVFFARPEQISAFIKPQC